MDAEAGQAEQAVRLAFDDQRADRGARVEDQHRTAGAAQVEVRNIAGRRVAGVGKVDLVFDIGKRGLGRSVAVDELGHGEIVIRQVRCDRQGAGHGRQDVAVGGEGQRGAA
ncbi:hypothetical protein D3C87_1135540 [compost metagenome]